MKPTLIIILIIFVTFRIQAQVDLREIRLINVKCQLNQVIDTVYNTNKPFYDENELVFIMNCKKKFSYYELKMAAVKKKNLPWLRRDSREKLRGFIKQDNKLVIVFGDLNPCFEETDIVEKFEWVQPLLPDTSSRKGKKPPPPRIFEPMVFIFEYRNNAFEFVKTGLVRILDYRSR